MARHGNIAKRVEMYRWREASDAKRRMTNKEC
jgi:hypothetical protein